jgi:F-type H+-transporting ATPase subunit b
MKLLRILLVVLVIIAILAPSMALAKKDHEKEGPTPFRKAWDEIWRWINFFILVFVIVRYGGKPIKEFLAKQYRQEVERVEQHRSMVDEARSEYESALKRLEEIEETTREIETFIMADAERLKREIIEDAEKMSEQIIEEARDRAMMRILNARQNLKKELVEEVFAKAEELIRRNIVSEDRERMIETNINEIAVAKAA